VPTLKYARELEVFENCPPPPAATAVPVCYRFVHDPITAGCFLPHAMKPTRRRLNRPVKDSCSAYAVSLFVSEASARKRYGELLRFSNADWLGTHLAMVRLRAADGQQTTPRGTGHFDLHEYDGAALHVAARLVGPLP
jgi:hypothetical protein